MGTSYSSYSYSWTMNAVADKAGWQKFSVNKFPAAASGQSSYGDLKTQFKNTGRYVDLSVKEEQSMTAWAKVVEYYSGDPATNGLSNTCAGTVKGITYYQLYKCIPTADGGGEIWTTTLSNLGPLAKTEIFLDKYKGDPTCTDATKCQTCGNAPAQAQIDIGMMFKCQMGSTVWSIDMGPNTRGKDGVVEYKPFLLPSYSTHNLYRSRGECLAYGVAPMVIQALPQRNGTTYMPTPCAASEDSCGVFGREKTLLINTARSLNPSYGLRTPADNLGLVDYTPGLAIGNATCWTYDLNYLAMLTLLVIPILIGTLVGIFVPVKPCPGCAGNDPSQRKNVAGWVDPRSKAASNTGDIALVKLGGSGAGVTV